MEHPFLDNSFHIQWKNLNPDHIESDISLALKNAQDNIDKIAAQDNSSVSYSSTLEAFESCTDELDDAWSIISHLDSVCNSPELRKAYNEMLPKVSEFGTQVYLNEKLWNVFKAFSDTDEAKGLSGTKKRLLEETIEDFKESGADLPADKKKEMEKIESELSQKTQKYSENVLDSTNAWELTIDNKDELSGLPQSALDAALQAAKEKGYGDDDSPKWLFTLHAPSLIPLLTYADNDELRKKVWLASSAVGKNEPYDNGELIQEILELRHQKSVILGKKHFADVTTKRRMAGSGEKALSFVEELHQHSKPAFTKECEELEKYKAEKSNSPVDRLEGWEVAYWAEKQRKELYDFDEEELRPYFPMDNVISGMFSICETIFGIKIKEIEGIDTWHPDVKFYDIHTDNGRHMGSFYSDWYPRESKRGGAWMNNLKTGFVEENGTNKPHLGLVCGNMSPPVGDKPALLTHREVETVFHEFGHLLHHLCGEVDIPSLNGINVVWDFVELPSQIMENWCWERESLDKFARHYETGEPIPEDLFKKMHRARNFQSAMGMMRQLSFGKMDLELHLNHEQYKGKDLDETIKSMLEDYTMKYKSLQPTIIRRFTHLFADSTGYAAGYYSYKWAEVLDADAFSRFQKEGILNPETGRDFRKCILSKGNSEPAEKLFRDFMGRDPDQAALLKRSNIQA